MTKDDYIQTLPFVLISFAILGRAFGVPDGFLTPIVVGGFALAQATPKPPNQSDGQ